MCFAAVEFPDDPNVAGQYYWYLCELEGVKAGAAVTAPLGRHNRLQRGVVRRVKFADEFDAPYPLWGIKKIREILPESP